MAGGSLNLASSQTTGDDILNINPQITFFKKVYKRHTNFGLEVKKNSVIGIADFGKTFSINIDNIGSLINEMHFEFTLPPATGIGTDENGDVFGVAEGADTNNGAVTNWKGYCHYVDAVGFAIINSIKLEINGNLMDEHDGLWFDIWNELTDPMRKEWPLVGKRDFDEDNVKYQNKKSRYYIPLKFWFNRNPGLSFPIFLLGENDVRIKITFNSLASLLKFDGDNNSTINSRSISDFKFFTNYVFLDKDEEARIKNNLPNEYLIENLGITKNATTSNLNKLDKFQNPVKEIIWVIRHNNRLRIADPDNNIIPKNNEIDLLDNDGNPASNTNANDIFNYSLVGENENLGYGSYDTFKTLKIFISNKNRIDETDATYFRTIQPYKYHSNTPGGLRSNNFKKYIYVYSFALNPEEYQPSGTYNFTKNDDILKLQFAGIGQKDANTSDNDLTNYRIDLFSFFYRYLKVSENSVEISDVPYVSNPIKPLSDAPALKGLDESVAKEIVKKKCRQRNEDAIREEEKKQQAIEEEVRRRYREMKPDVHRHQNFTKKKWAGLQGDFTKN